MTIYAQQKRGAIVSVSSIPFGFRIENSLVSCLRYIYKTFWPRDLAVFYPYPTDIPLWQAIGALMLLLLASVAAVRCWRDRPYITVGWFWFLVMLVPVIGLIQVGSQAMADRYTYLPVIGLFIMAAWGVPAATQNVPYRSIVLAVLAAATVAGSAVLTYQQASCWRDNITLYRHALQVTTNNFLTNISLGCALANKGDLDAGIVEFREALRINPRDELAHINLGLALGLKGDMDSAIREIRAAIQNNPRSELAHFELGLAYMRANTVDAAIPEFEEALRINPRNEQVHLQLAAALAGKHDLQGAIRHFREATGINPYNAKTYYSLGSALAQTGDLKGAVRELTAALRLDPGDIRARHNLGSVLANSGDLDGAIREFGEVLRLNPQNPMARQNLEAARAQKVREGK
jgi:tetratricopeptide (TPR) repeat protein